MMKQLLFVLAIILTLLSSTFAQANLKAEYYNGTNFEEYVGTEYVSNLDFYWNHQGPIDGLNPNVCSVRYTGQLIPPTTGEVTFSARVDDGIRVWINDELIIENWRLNDVGLSDGKIHLTANTSYTIKIEYFNAMREAELRLLWQLPDDPELSWFSNWWYRSKPLIISSDHFLPPIKEELIQEPLAKVEEPQITTALVQAKPIPKPAPKPKVKPKAKPTPQPAEEPVVQLEEKPAPLETAIKIPLADEQSLVLSQSKLTIDTLQKYIPKNVEFERAKSKILSISYADLDKLGSFLVNHSYRKVKIEGHTDNVGDSDKNLILSQERAKAIEVYLINHGVNADQIISTIGYGGNRPLIKSDGIKHNPENRRVEFIIQ